MKNLLLKKSAIFILIFAIFQPMPGYADVVSDVKAYLEERNPQSLGEYLSVFAYIYDEHAPAIKESTQTAVLYYFGSIEDPKLDDIITLANYAVTSAIARADAEIAIAKATDEEGKDKRGFYMTDAVCGSYKGALGAAYQNSTASWKTVEGGIKGALATGVEQSFATIAVNRGIDVCLNERKDERIGTTDFPTYETQVCVENCVTEEEPPCVTNCI